MKKKELTENNSLSKKRDLRNVKLAKLKFKYKLNCYLSNRSLNKTVNRCILITESELKSENQSIYKILFPMLNKKSINKIKNSLEDVIASCYKLISSDNGVIEYNEDIYESFNSVLISFYPFQSYNEFKNLNRIIFRNTKHMKAKYDKYIKYYNQIIYPKEIKKDPDVMDKCQMKREVNEGGGNANRKDKDELRLLINEMRENNFGDF